MNRRRWLRWGCAHCASLAGLSAAQTPDWSAPARFSKPDLATDEGGLWAMMDREEARLRRSPFRIRDDALTAYLTDLTCRMAGAHCPDLRVYAVRAPYFNASMAPNGMMQVWTGLLLRADNEAQLAAVIGHELGHYLQRHSLAQLRDVRGRTAFMSVMAAAGAVGLIASLGALAGAMSFSREAETEADRIGLVLMRQGGYDPREAAKVWANLRAELSAGVGGDPAKRSIMFATHPATDERQRLLENLSAGQDGERGDQAYAARIDPHMGELLDDELRRAQYDETLVLLARLAQRRPQRGDLRWARGEALRLRNQEGDLLAAQAELEAALGLDKPPAHTHRSLGLLHRSLGRKPEAAQALKTYLSLAPQAADAAMVQSYLTELQ